MPPQAAHGRRRGGSRRWLPTEARGSRRRSARGLVHSGSQAKRGCPPPLPATPSTQRGIVHSGGRQLASRQPMQGVRRTPAPTTSSRAAALRGHDSVDPGVARPASLGSPPSTATAPQKQGVRGTPASPRPRPGTRFCRRNAAQQRPRRRAAGPRRRRPQTPPPCRVHGGGTTGGRGRTSGGSPSPLPAQAGGWRRRNSATSPATVHAVVPRGVISGGVAPGRRRRGLLQRHRPPPPPLPPASRDLVHDGAPPIDATRGRPRQRRWRAAAAVTRTRARREAQPSVTAYRHLGVGGPL